MAIEKLKKLKNQITNSKIEVKDLKEFVNHKEIQTFIKKQINYSLDDGVLINKLECCALGEGCDVRYFLEDTLDEFKKSKLKNKFNLSNFQYNHVEKALCEEIIFLGFHNNSSENHMEKSGRIIFTFVEEAGTFSKKLIKWFNEFENIYVIPPFTNPNTKNTIHMFLYNAVE